MYYIGAHLSRALALVCNQTLIYIIMWIQNDNRERLDRFLFFAIYSSTPVLRNSCGGGYFLQLIQVLEAHRDTG